MNNKTKKILFSLLTVIIWLSVWEAVARLVDISFAIPTVAETLRAFSSLVTTSSFWIVILCSVGRILIGFVIGVILGVIFAVLTHYSQFIDILFSPIMTVIRSTPVASFIMVLWILIGSQNVPTSIAVLMVMPVIWQNLTEGLNSFDNSMLELCQIFEFSRKKRIKHIVIPTLAKYLLPAAITSIGLAWKAGIAAEIIAYTRTSIGKEIFDSKNFFMGADMFAWTLTVVLLSLLFEILIKNLGRRVKDKNESDN